MPQAIKTSIVEDSDTPPVSELGAPVGKTPTNTNNNSDNGRDGIISQAELDKLWHGLFFGNWLWESLVL